MCLCVCVSICSHSSCIKVHLYLQPTTPIVFLGFSWIQTCGFLKKPSVQELWHVKANMQIRWNSLRAIFVHLHNEEQEQPERQLVSRKLLQTLSTGSSCQKTCETQHCIPCIWTRGPRQHLSNLELVFFDDG